MQSFKLTKYIKYSGLSNFIYESYDPEIAHFLLLLLRPFDLKVNFISTYLFVFFLLFGSAVESG